MVWGQVPQSSPCPRPPPEPCPWVPTRPRESLCVLEMMRRSLYHCAWPRSIEHQFFFHLRLCRRTTEIIINLRFVNGHEWNWMKWTVRNWNLMYDLNWIFYTTGFQNILGSINTRQRTLDILKPASITLSRCMLSLLNQAGSLLARPGGAADILRSFSTLSWVFSNTAMVLKSSGSTRSTAFSSSSVRASLSAPCDMRYLQQDVRFNSLLLSRSWWWSNLLMQQQELILGEWGGYYVAIWDGLDWIISIIADLHDHVSLASIITSTGPLHTRQSSDVFLISSLSLYPSLSLSLSGAALKSLRDKWLLLGLGFANK